MNKKTTAEKKQAKACCKDEVTIEQVIVESNFALRKDLGVNKITFNDGQSISLTDAPDTTCIGFLAANPARISMFEKYPENWMELINNEKENDNE